MILYWVGDTDSDWDTVNNWATISGGVGGANGAQVPTISDDVILDGSFNSVITVNCDCDVNFTVASLTVENSYDGFFTVSAGTHNSAGDVLIANGGGGVYFQINMELDCWGHYEDFVASSFGPPAAWILNMRGSGKHLWPGARHDGITTIYDDTIIDHVSSCTWVNLLSVEAGATCNLSMSITFELFSSVYVAGNLNLDAGSWCTFQGDFAFVTGGSVTGGASAYFIGDTITITEATGEISLSNMWIQKKAEMAPGTYNSPIMFSLNQALAHSVNFAAGTYFFRENVNFACDKNHTYTVNCALSPDLYFAKNLTLQEFNGTMNWSKGTGALTFNGTVNQTVDFLDLSVENIVVNKGGGILLFGGNFTATSFEAISGNFNPNGKTLETTGDFTVRAGVNTLTEMPGNDLWDYAALTVGGLFNVKGLSSNYCNMKGGLFGLWTLNVASSPGGALAEHVHVSGCNAAAGMTIQAKDSIDG